MANSIEKSPKSKIIERIKAAGIIAIMRHTDPTLARKTVDALITGGVSVVEVTMNSEDATETIEELAITYQEDILIGAGTVLTTADAEAAITTGAQFIVAPNTRQEVIGFCRDHEVPVIPGALTPTEVVTAWQQGADLVKIFPVGSLGPGYLRDLRGPLGNIPFVPTGGVNIKNASAFIQAGSAALGVGSDLVHREIVQRGDFTGITERAKAFVDAVAEGRGRRYDHSQEDDHISQSTSP